RRHWRQSPAPRSRSAESGYKEHHQMFSRQNENRPKLKKATSIEKTDRVLQHNPLKATKAGCCARSDCTRRRRRAVEQRDDSRCLFEALVGAAEQRRRHCKAERLRDLEVDHKLEPRRFLNWKVTGFLTAHDLRDVGRRAPPKIGSARAVARQPACHRKFAQFC